MLFRSEWSVRQLEDRIREMQDRQQKDGTEIEKNDNSIADDYYHAVEKIGRYFRKGATVKKTASGGVTISIHVSDDSEVEKFVSVLDKISD